MGNKNKNRYPTFQPLLRNKIIPLRWIGSKKISKPIIFNKFPNVQFYSLKTPIPISLNRVFSNNYLWNTEEVIKSIKNASKFENPLIYVINVSSNYNFTDEEWIKNNYIFSRIPISKDYSFNSLEKFHEVTTNFIKENISKQIIFLIYCSTGINRTGFCITSFGYKFCEIPLKDCLFNFSEMNSVGIYKNKAIEALSNYFNINNLNIPSIPPLYSNENTPIPIGEIPLPLDHYINWKKIINEEIIGEEKLKILLFLQENLPINFHSDNLITQNFVIWNSNSFNEIKNNKYYCSFYNRSNQSFLFSLDKSKVYIMTSNLTIYSLQAIYNSNLPFIALCNWFDEKKKITCILNDLIMFNGEIISNLSLKERLSILYSDFLKLIKSDIHEKDINSLKFLYRPIDELSYVKKLKNDLKNIFCKPDSICFINSFEINNYNIILPIDYSVLLQFDYNGGNYAVLSARSKDSTKNIPISIFEFNDKSFRGLDGRTNRFNYDFKNNKWTINAIGSNDPASTLNEIEEIFSFISNKFDIDDIMNKF